MPILELSASPTEGQEVEMTATQEKKTTGLQPHLHLEYVQKRNEKLLLLPKYNWIFFLSSGTYTG